MKFVIPQGEFLKLLLISTKSLSSRVNLPILSNILITALKDTIEIVSTDLETAIKISAKCRISSQGEITVGGKNLLEFVSQLPPKDMTLEKLGEEALVSLEGYKGRFATIVPQEFPAIPRIEKGLTIELAARDLAKALERVAFCASQDEGRPTLTGVLCEVASEKLSMVATDGYRLSYDEVVAKTAKKESFKIIIPAKSLAQLAKIMVDLGGEEETDKKNGQTVSVLVAQNFSQINFKYKNVEFTSRLIEGEFPNWRKTIPAEFPTKVKILKEEFTRLIRIASVFARDAGNIIRMKIEGGEGKKQGILSVAATASQAGSSESQTEVEVTGEGGEIAFNFRYLLEVLAAIDDEEISFEMIESLTPGRITGAGGKGDKFFYIIMPVRLQA